MCRQYIMKVLWKKTYLQLLCWCKKFDIWGFLTNFRAGLLNHRLGTHQGRRRHRSTKLKGLDRNLLDSNSPGALSIQQKPKISRTEWNSNFRVFRNFRKKRTTFWELDANFRKFLPENFCSIRICYQNFRNFRLNGSLLKIYQFPDLGGNFPRKCPFHSFWSCFKISGNFGRMESARGLWVDPHWGQIVRPKFFLNLSGWTKIICTGASAVLDYGV